MITIISCLHVKWNVLDCLLCLCLRFIFVASPEQIRALEERIHGATSRKNFHLVACLGVLQTLIKPSKFIHHFLRACQQLWRCISHRGAQHNDVRIYARFPLTPFGRNVNQPSTTLSLSCSIARDENIHSISFDIVLTFKFSLKAKRKLRA